MSVANTCTPKFEPGQRITAKASAAVTGKRLVAISGDVTSEGNFQVAHAVANETDDYSAAPIGVAAHDCAQGDLVTVIVGGVAPVDPSADITAGAKLTTAAAGKVVTASAATNYIVGTAMTTADESDGDDVYVLLNL